MEGVRCIGGQFLCELCTAKLQKENEKQYEFHKINYWLSIVQNDGARPTRWLKPTTKGTNVNFRNFESREEYKAELGKLKGYIEALNEKFNSDWSLEINEKD